jgi:uncharacterized protein YhfF
LKVRKILKWLSPACIACAAWPLLAAGEGLPVTEDARAFWRECARGLGAPAGGPLRARRIGSTPETIEMLLGLVLAREKTITSTSPWLYDDGLQAAPMAGDIWVMMDSAGRPAAVLRTTSVKVLPMDQVTEEDSRHEGPGARPIEAWRRVHWNFFMRVLAPLGKVPAPDMPVTLEYFEVLCPRPAQ